MHSCVSGTRVVRSWFTLRKAAGFLWIFVAYTDHLAVGQTSFWNVESVPLPGEKHGAHARHCIFEISAGRAGVSPRLAAAMGKLVCVEKGVLGGCPPYS